MEASHCISIEKLNATIEGVGMLIGPRALKSLNSVKKIQPRMMVATFYGNSRATIISCYSTVNVSEETELITFYDELSSLVRSIPKHNVLVIGVDMNAPKHKPQKNINQKLSQLVKQKWTTSDGFHDRK